MPVAATALAPARMAANVNTTVAAELMVAVDTIEHLCPTVVVEIANSATEVTSQGMKAEVTTGVTMAEDEVEASTQPPSETPAATLAVSRLTATTWGAKASPGIT